MAPERLLHEGKRCRLVAGLGDKTFEHLALVIDRAAEVMHLSVDLYIDLVEVPTPMAKPSHRLDALPPDVACEHRTKPVPPQPHGLMAEINAALEE